LHITLLSAIGTAVDVHSIDLGKMRDAIKLVTSLPRSPARGEILAA
jgi:hypothetical protein